MAFTVSTIPAAAGDRSGEAFVLTAGDVRAEVWPTHGFNCLRWQTRRPDEEWADLLFVAPDWATNPVPTRSGHPVLFPFPNRMRAGRFTFDGRDYQLAKNESSGANAIHGYTAYHPWRVTAAGTDAGSASVAAEFRLSADAPNAVWPADARLALTYRLTPSALRVEAVVDAADGKAMPFGLGYHPYFRIPGTDDASAFDLHARAGELWELADGLPTGRRVPASGDLDFRTPKPLAATKLDTLYTAVAADPTTGEMATVAAPGGRVAVCGGPEWRELMLFTPVHRRAVAVEPYTCTADAANLVGSGWRVLAAGERFAADVEYRWQPTP